MSDSSYSSEEDIPTIPYSTGDTIYAKDDSYKIGQMLGYGTFAKVMMGSNKGVDYALKIYFDDEGSEREVKIMRRISSPFVLKVIDFFEVKDTNTKVLVLEVLQSDLFEYIHSFESFKVVKSRPPMTIVKSISRQLLSAVYAIGAGGFVHTDLKPENILISNIEDEINIKVADFGTAILIGKKPRQYGHTSEYRSPEMIFNNPLTSSSDVWATGAIIFELLTGDFMFSPKESQTFDDCSSDWSSSSSTDHLLDLEHLALMQETLGKFPKSISRMNRSYFKL